MKVPAPLLVGVGVGLVAVLGIAWAGRRAVELAKENAHLVNPADNRNLAYAGVVGGVGRALSGDEHWSLGSWLWEVTHSDAVAAERDLTKGAPPAVSPAVDPSSWFLSP